MVWHNMLFTFLRSPPPDVYVDQSISRKRISTVARRQVYTSARTVEEEDSYAFQKCQDVIHQLHATVMEQQQMTRLGVDPDLVGRSSWKPIVDRIRLATTTDSAESSIV